MAISGVYCKLHEKFEPDFPKNKNINFYRDDEYGPNSDKTEFLSDKNFENETGIFSINKCLETGKIRATRVRMSDTTFKNGIEFGKYKPVSSEEVLSYFNTKSKRIASIIGKDIKKIKKSKKPTVFLGGSTDTNKWRDEIKKEFKDKFFFIDPYDPKWDPEDNIYDELAGMAIVDYVVFYKGGVLSKREKEFLETLDKKYKNFEDLDDMRDYLNMIKTSNKKACLDKRLYRSAAILLMRDTLNRVLKESDDMSGKIHREKEKCIILEEIPEECKGKKPIIIKQGILREAKKDGDVISYARIRMKKDPGKDPVYSLGVKNFKLSQETEAEISKQMFDSFYPDFLEKPQEKKRFKLSNGWEIDVMEDKVVAEYEQKPGEKAKIPDEWKVKEVKNYKMASYEYSSLQIQIPARISKKIKEFGSEIPKKELAIDGLEKDSHITILYGILDENPDQLKKLLKTVKAFPVCIKKSNCFTVSPNFDVVMFDVNSPDLQRLNLFIRKNCSHKMTHPEYNPHATVGYLKKGYGPKYTGCVLDETFIANELKFCSKNGKDTIIKLKSK